MKKSCISAILSLISAQPFIIALLLTTAAINAIGQTTSSYDGQTPSGLAPGSPAGVYALSDFDTINLYSGKLNFRLPLISIGGRGSAGYTYYLTIEKRWDVRSRTDIQNCSPQGCVTITTHWPSDTEWAGVPRDQSAGTLLGRQTGKKDRQTCSSCPEAWTHTITRLTFIAPDGTEYELRDKLHNGARLDSSAYTCNPGTGPDRGRVWTTVDDSAATFISDTDITDTTGACQYSPNSQQGLWIHPSGYMLMRDGTRYRIDSGRVTWIRDRNGNKITISGTPVSGTTVDSLNRQIIFGEDDSPDHLIQRKTITYRGTNGASRTIIIETDYTTNDLRADYRPGGANYQPGGDLPGGTGDKSFAWLFPSLNGPTANPGPFLQGPTSVILPDGHRYRFYYNPYTELARVELPTGGAIEYDWDGGPGTNIETNGLRSGVVWPYAIYRRVIERRVYADGVTLTEKTRFTASEGVNSDDVTTVDRLTPSGALLARSKHYFYGNACSSLYPSFDPTDYENIRNGREYKMEEYAADGATLLRREENTWQARASYPDFGLAPNLEVDLRVVESRTTLYDTGQVSRRSFEYDDYNNVTRLEEYDYGAGAPGGLLRLTLNQYLTSGYDTVAGDANNPNVAATIHLRNLPTSQAVYSDIGTSNKVAETTYEYDNYTASDGYHAQLVARPGITGLCDGSPQNCPGGPNFADPNYTAHGNVTRISHWLNTTGGAVSAYQQYDVAGNVVKAIDANGDATTLDFSDRFGAPDDDARQNTPPAELNGQTTYAFATRVANALGHEAYTQYDYFLGRPVNSEEANGIVSSVAYNDILDRPTQGIQARYVVGVGVPAVRRQATVTYDDANRVITTTSDFNTFNDNILTAKSYYDGLGRTRRGAAREGDTWAIADTLFDALGRVSQVSNPYRATDPDSASPPSGAWAEWTTTDYDTLGRVIQVTTPDGAHVDTAYSGNQMTVADQAVKKRRSETDALGRLIKITEDPGGLNYETFYSYDALGNLRQVTQGAQTRTFVYDSLLRLTSATNPESGPMTYAYDPNGNLMEKTDARGVKTTMTYDALNRARSKAYSGTTSEGTAVANLTPPVNYFYDDYSGLPTGAPSWSGTPSKGRLIGVTYGTGSEGTYYKYDAAGRIVTNHQRMVTSNYASAYFYNLASAVTREERGIPARRRNLMSYDAAGRLAAMDTGAYPILAYIPLVRNISYTPFGGLQSETYGNELIHSMAYNSRHQPIEIRLGRPDDLESVFRIGYIFGTANNVNGQDAEITAAHNNGNVARIKYLISGTVQYTQTFQYDPLNRLGYAVEHNNGVYGDASRAWYQTFDYDRYGNRGINVANTSDNADAANMALPLADFSVANNRITHTGYLYDGAGNLSAEPGKSYTYDAENRIVTAIVAGGATSQYVYDGNGRRVKKIMGGVGTRFEYGAGGELIAEWNDADSPNKVVQKDYFYKGGELIATTKAGASGEYQYGTADHLGSPRAWTDDSGALIAGGRHDYLPFGEELFAGVGTRTTGQGYAATTQTDGQRKQFDAYERDSETGLDYLGARYMSSMQGRFTSPDPFMGSGRLWIPQSLNRYSYVINNPLRYTDEDGLDWYINENRDVQWFEKNTQPKGWTPFNPPDNRYNINDKQSVILNPNGPTTNGQTQEERQGWSYGPHVDDQSRARSVVVMAGVVTVAQPEGPGEGAGIVLLLYALYLALHNNPVTPTAVTPPALTTTIPPMTLPGPIDPNVFTKAHDGTLIEEVAREYGVNPRDLAREVEKEKEGLRDHKGRRPDKLSKEQIEEIAEYLGGKKK